MNADKVEEALNGLLKALRAADVQLERENIIVECAAAPHDEPIGLPSGWFALYAFFRGDVCLKCGKAGSKSAARYIYQHYSPGSAPSTLAKTLLMRGAAIGVLDLQPSTVGEWIRQNTTRINLLFPVSMGASTLAFCEAFLHLYWQPIFEGREP